MLPILALGKALHLLAAVVWVGGMFFAYMALRPAAAQLLEPPQRLSLWVGTFQRFFRWVWLAVAVLLLTGLQMIFGRFAGFAHSPLFVHLMLLSGLVMIAIFAHVYFAPYTRLKHAVSTADWPAGGAALGQIRRLVGINLLLGVLTVTLAGLGSYLGAWP